MAADLFVFDHQKASRRCRDQGLTYAVLGASTGRGDATIRNWLRGASDPPASMVGALALLLNLDHPGDLYRPATPSDLAVEVRPMIQIKTQSRRRRLARPGVKTP